MAFIGALVLLSITFGAKTNFKFELDQGKLLSNLTTSVKMYEDFYYGSFKSTGNNNLDQIYQDIRYRILNEAAIRFFQDNGAANTTAKVYRTSTNYGYRSLCSALQVPFIAAASGYDRTRLSLGYTDYVRLVLDQQLPMYYVYGDFFVASLSEHINSLVDIFNNALVSPDESIKQAYNNPSFGLTTDTAALACIKNIRTLR